MPISNPPPSDPSRGADRAGLIPGTLEGVPVETPQPLPAEEQAPAPVVVDEPAEETELEPTEPDPGPDGIDLGEDGPTGPDGVLIDTDAKDLDPEDLEG